MSDSREQIIEKIVRGTPEERRYICSKSLLFFSIYYFSEYFNYKIAPFHRDFYEDANKLAQGELNEVAWIAFRESAKTSIAKIFVIWCIAYKKKRYISYDSYDKSNAEAALFDIVVSLQTNHKLKADFGELYHEKREDGESKLKRVSSFITANKIKVEAFSTQESTRGRIYQNNRPDLFVLDDIETSKTKDSIPVTQKIIAHINEMKAGLSANGSVLYLGNYISENGVIQHVMDSVGRNLKGVVRNVPVVKNGAITWPDKYVATDAEALDSNKTLTKDKFKISIESKKRDLGSIVFHTEMMNDPVSAHQNFFDRKKIDSDLQSVRSFKEDKAGFLMWDSYNPSHRYAIGGDTSMGVGLDSNASVAIDFSTIPAKQVASFASNEIAPDVFAHELKREGDILGTCLIAPEVNSQSGGTCLNELKRIYPLDMIFRRMPKDKFKDIPTDKIGWETNSATKPEMLFQLKSAYEDGKLLIQDERILREMRSFGQIDVSSLDNSTRHFDLLIATAIAWAMRNFAKVKVPYSSYTQPEYEKPGL